MWGRGLVEGKVGGQAVLGRQQWAPTPPNSPSYLHTISVAPKLVKRNFSATPTNQIKKLSSRP